MSRQNGMVVVTSLAVMLAGVVFGCTGRGTANGNGTVVSAEATAADHLPLAQSSVTWNFDRDTGGSPPAEFSFGRTGSGRPGRWVVRSAPDAPSTPNTLAQEDNDDTDNRFPVAVENTLRFGDASVSVRCKPVSGRVDQACGIVWRYRDVNNYYLARANALENNVNFYYVQDGRRREVEGSRSAVSSGVWHQLRADMRGDRVEVYFDGRRSSTRAMGASPHQARSVCGPRPIRTRSSMI
jgi:hypothetical protein